MGRRSRKRSPEKQAGGGVQLPGKVRRGFFLRSGFALLFIICIALLAYRQLKPLPTPKRVILISVRHTARRPARLLRL